MLPAAVVMRLDVIASSTIDSPAADGIPPLLTLDATVELASARGTRSLPLAHFLTGPRATRRAPDEVLTAIEVPATPPDAVGAFEKLGARRYLVISVAMVAAILRLDPAGRITEARIAVGACSPVALRLTALEADLIGQSPEAPDLSPHHLAALTPIEDPRGTASYRIAAARELVRRAIGMAGARHG